MAAREKVMCLLSHRPMIMKFKRPIVKDTYFDVKLYEPKLGMGFKGTRVTSIAPGGWAERSGILEHDLIIEVDGEDFKALNTRERVEVLKRDRPLVLTIKRPSDIIEMRLKKGLPPLVTAEEIAAKEHIGIAAAQKEMELAAVFEPLEDGEVRRRGNACARGRYRNTIHNHVSHVHIIHIRPTTQELLYYRSCKRGHS